MEPVFLKAGDLAAETDFLELCVAAERISGRETVAGAQRIRCLWRIYPLTREARTSFLVSGVELHGQTLVCFDKNPYILRGGSEAPTTKLYVSDIPISVDNGEIRNLLGRLGCTIRSPLVSERARNKDGKLTRFLTGRRFVFIEIPSSPLQRTVEVGPFRATLYHKEMKSKDPKCGKCLQTGHVASTCNSNIVCRSCFKSGHMAKDGKCENLNTPGENTTVPPPPPPPPTRTNGRAQPTSRSTEGASGTTGVRGPAAGTERSKRTRSASRSPESEKHENKKREKMHVSRADSFFRRFMPQTTNVRWEKEQQQEAKEDGT